MAKVLVVDDSAIVRNLHTFMLKSAGFEVTEAVNGYDALEKLLSTNFDLIVADINMPKMDGYTLCEEIRKNDVHKDAPIIIISTESEAEDKIKGFNAGANLYLVKPVKAEDLIENAKMLLKD
ncbi:MAG: two-component system chemotaxis response regulator CheY [bacterium]|jgi:two-component system chemotaxis response regulator CheY